MALPGEIIASGAAYNGKCPDCGMPMPIKVCQSGAGFYIGTWCDGTDADGMPCGPYSRESGYYETYALAEAALKNGYQPRST